MAYQKGKIKGSGNRSLALSKNQGKNQRKCRDEENHKYQGTEDEGSLPLLHVKRISDDDLVGTASAFPTASDSKAEGEGSKLVSAAEHEDMVGSESSEEGPEPFETERADEVNCSVYGSNVNCRELDVLDVNSDCPAKVKLAELFVEENKGKQTGNMVGCLTHDHQVFDKNPERNLSLLEACLASDVSVGKICGPADPIPQGTGSFGIDKSHPCDKGVKPSWADIVEGWGGTNVDK
ncbi:hypothetical protein U1Q18_007542, partial [Sarracenia purpurea var. burkii]